MMSAKEAAKHTLAAVREQNVVNALEDLIMNAAQEAQTQLHLSLDEVGAMFGEISPGEVSLPAQWPIPLRFAMTEMNRAGYDAGFAQYGDGWHLDISWKSELVY